MTYQLVFTESYNKRAKRFLKKHPDIAQQYCKTLKLLAIDPYHPSLRLHQLKGKLKTLHSVSVNLRYRITLELYIKGKQVILVDVGDHAQVYFA